MTPEQEKQFSDFGCACRCLIFLANINSNSITKDQFIDQFSKDYSWWEVAGKCGLTDTGMIFDIARKLNLTTSLQILRNPNVARESIKAGKTGAILFFTEKKEEAPVDGKKSFSDYFHCSIMRLSPLITDRVQCFQIDNNIKPCPQYDILDSELNLVEGYFGLFS